MWSVAHGFLLLAVLFTEVLRGTCTLIFQTSCKIAAVGAIFNSPDFLDCQNILSYGPSQDAPDTCADQSSALQIFSGYADNICEQEVDDEELANLSRSPAQVTQPTPPPPSPSSSKEEEEISMRNMFCIALFFCMHWSNYQMHI